MNLAGLSPNGQEFTPNPQPVWLVRLSRAAINGVDLGPPGPRASSGVRIPGTKQHLDPAGCRDCCQPAARLKPPTV